MSEIISFEFIFEGHKIKVTGGKVFCYKCGVTMGSPMSPHWHWLEIPSPSKALQEEINKLTPTK